MTAERIILWRHGQTDLNRDFRIQGALDIPLNNDGFEQAREVLPYICAFEPTAVICSTKIRARQTAGVFLDGHPDVPVTYDERLVERTYGQWEGMTSVEIRENFPEKWHVWRSGGHPEGVGVETREACGTRVAAAVLEAAEAMESGTLLVVAHGGSIVNGIMTIIGHNPSEWSGLDGMSNCHFAWLKHRGGEFANPKWRIAGYNLPGDLVLAPTWK